MNQPPRIALQAIDSPDSMNVDVEQRSIPIVFLDRIVRPIHQPPIQRAAKALENHPFTLSRRSTLSPFRHRVTSRYAPKTHMAPARSRQCLAAHL